MSYKTYNPYPQLREQFTDGMNYIIENILSSDSEISA